MDNPYFDNFMNTFSIGLKVLINIFDTYPRKALQFMCKLCLYYMKQHYLLCYENLFFVIYNE